ncbi:HlyD family secretion protein [Pantoea sp. M_5]|nr:HlyD family secretion protein [Pantoea sp. M_5]
MAPKVSGYVSSVQVQDNQQVKAGQLLATLDDRDYRVALESATADLQVSQAKLLSSQAQLEQQQSVIDQQKASVAASQASAQYAGQSAERYNRLYKSGTVAADDQQKASSTQRSALAAVHQSQAALASAVKQVGVLQAAVRSAEADVAAAKASVDQARLNLSYTRIVAPVDGMVGQRAVRTGAYVSAGTRQSQAALASAVKQVGVLQAAVRSAEADVAAAKASVDQARLNLSYTRIVAPVDGMVGQRAVRTGAYVSAGTRLLAVVPLQQTYVTANYLETQLSDVRPGQRVQIRVDALPGRTFTGHVDSMAPATGATFSAISPDNATGNYTKVVQRLPVKIVLDSDQPNLAQLRVGMSAIPDIDVP